VVPTKEKMLFYCCLYHSFYTPRLVARKGEEFTGLDGKAQKAPMIGMGPCPSGIPDATRLCCLRC
jgi:hypothetical protein